MQRKILFLQVSWIVTRDVIVSVVRLVLPLHALIEINLEYINNNFLKQ